MPNERAYAAPQATVAIRRQKGSGFYNKATSSLLPLLMTNFQPKLSGAMASLGIEVGGNTITEQRSQKQSFSPSCTLSGHIRVGALMNVLDGLGYKPITKGESLGVPVTTTTTAVLQRHRKKLPVTATTSITTNDYVMIGTVSGTPAFTDTCEVHQVASVGTTAVDEVQTVTIYGGATGGTFTLTDPVSGTVSAALAYNASTATVQAALVAVYGAGTRLVTGAPGAWIVTGAGTDAGKALPLLVGNGDNLTGGTGYGANAGLEGETSSWVDVQITTEGTIATYITLKTGLLFAQAATGVAVEKVDPNKAFTSYHWHVQPDDATDNDGFSLFAKWSNGTQTVSLLYFGGKTTRFDLSYQTGQIATFNAEFKFEDVYVIDPSTVTLGTDPAPVVLNNTRGNATFLSDTVNYPRAVSINNAAEVPDDFTLFHYKPQSVIHTGYTLSMTTEGKFIKTFSDKINFNNTDLTASDLTPEYPLTFNFLSQSLVGTSNTPASLSIVASDVQYGEYNPQLATNQFISANIGMIKVVPSASNAERWYYKSVSGATSDAFSSI